MAASPSTGSVSFQGGIRCLRLLFLLGFFFALSLTLFTSAESLQSASERVALYLFTRQDTLWLGLGCVTIMVLLTTVGRRNFGISAWFLCLPSLPRLVAVMTLATLLVTATGVHVVYHDYALSLDEFLARFQAQTWLGGHVLAPLKAEWADMAPALQPTFMRYDLAHGIWGPAYRPMAAALIALFELVHLGKYSNAILAAGCLPVLAALARRLWPAEGQAPALAVFLLASAPQFLITASTPYAMTAHLFFSLLWLWFFLRGGVGGHIGAALTGLVAVGLHQINVHPFFVLPFLLSLLSDRRLRLAAAYALWYAAVLVFWVLWRDIVTIIIATNEVTSAAEGQAFLKQITFLLERHSTSDLAYWLANLFRFFAWQNLILSPLLFVALMHWRQAPRPVRLLAWGIALSLLPYLLLMPSQGHGWGYRYLHPHLGSFALIAVYGWLQLKASLEAEALERARRLLFMLAAVSVLIGLPLRAVQVERFVAPFATSSAYIAALPNDVVLVDGLDTWFGIDLVRNDPFLERGPKVLEANRLTDAALDRLCRRRVALVDFETLQRFGMTVMPRSPGVREAARRELRRTLQQHGCLPS